MRDYSPEALRRAATEFYARKERDTPKIRKEFEAGAVGVLRRAFLCDVGAEDLA